MLRHAVNTLAGKCHNTVEGNSPKNIYYGTAKYHRETIKSIRWSAECLERWLNDLEKVAQRNQPYKKTDELHETGLDSSQQSESGVRS